VPENARLLAAPNRYLAAGSMIRSCLLRARSGWLGQRAGMSLDGEAKTSSE
jgi:hypothetical protein